MNTKTILSAIVTLMLSLNIYASEPLVLTNELLTDSGRQIEQIFYIKGTNQLDKRTLRHFDLQGNLTQKVIYDWVAFDGWQPMRQLAYTYTDQNVLADVTLTQWNVKNRKWETQSEKMHYAMGVDGIYLASKSK